MFFKKIIQKNIKTLIILGFMCCFFATAATSVLADNTVTLGAGTYTTSSYWDSSISDPVGAVADPSDSNKIQSIVVADANGNKMQVHFNSNGMIDEILDSKNQLYYNSSSGAAVGTTDLQNTLNDLAKISGYKGNLANDVIAQRNIYYNNQLIDKLNGTGKCEVKDTLWDSYAQTVYEDVKKGILTQDQGQAINMAIRGNAAWTPTLAQQFKGAMNSNLSNFQSAFFWGDAQQAVECAIISAATQADKDKAIATLQQLNKTGGSLKDLTGDQLDNLVSTTNAGVTSGGGVGSASAVAQEVSGTVNRAAQDTQSEQLDQCTTFSVTGGFGINIGACIANILYFILSILSFFLGIVGLFFNTVFNVTLVNMQANVSKIGIVSAGWATIRDFANILFIFMLLYLAISTILQLDDHGVKRGLSRLIVGAVLINFSLFFVKIPIDISNILAIEIYDKITVNGQQNGPAGGYAGLGDAIMAMFSPQQVFNNDTLDPKTINQGSTIGQSPNQTGWNLQKNPLTTFAMGIIIIFTALLVFLAVCIIFIKRFITLVLLMIFSPLAFAGMAVPSHDIEHQISSSFWNSLLKESFYAPVFMFMMYLTIRTGEAINLTGLIGASTEGAVDWAITLPVTNIISYSVVMGMMIFSLTVSETMGVKGASGAIKMFDGARGMATSWAATNTIGRLAYTRANKGQSAEDLARDAAGQRGITRQVLARGQLALLKNIGKGFGEKVHATEEYKKGYDDEKHNDPNTRAEMLVNNMQDNGLANNLSSGLQANDKMAHHWNAEENANVKLALEKMKKGYTAVMSNANASDKEKKAAEIALKKTEGALARYYTGGTIEGQHIHARLTPEMANKVARAEFGELDHYNDEFRAILEGPKAEMAAKIKEFVQNAKSEAAVIGALKSAGEAMNKIKGDSVIKQSLSDALRDKFNGEAAYASIAKDPIMDKEVRAAISAGGFYSKMTADLYDALQDPDNKGDKGKMEVEFKKMLGKINNKEIEKAVATNNLGEMLKAYKENKLGDDRPTQNFFTKDNGNRSQTQSPEIIAELEALAKMGVVVKSK